MDPVKFCADILPARGNQNITFKINDSDADVGQTVKVIQHHLKIFNIQDVLKFGRIGSFQSGSTI